MMGPKEVLNRIKWAETDGFQDIEVWYIHRGAPQDTKIVTENDIKSLGKSYLELEEASIPYHRIIKIIHRGKVVYERKNR